MQRAPEVVRSRSNPLVRRFRAVRAGGGRAEGLALVEGVKLLEEAVAAGIRIVELAATPRPVARARRAIDAAVAAGAEARVVDEAVLASLSEAETSQGVVALARRPSFDPERIFRDVPLVVVAVGLQNPGNLGGLLRTAEAAGATGAFATLGSADPFSWKALRGSMGSAFRLPHVSGLALEKILASLRKHAVRTVATVAAGGVRYNDADFRGPLAFLLGNEGAGLPETVAREADLRVAIRMRGGVESLNVGVAAGVLLFEAARQRGR
jgi:TrmH family RNA methyltransferase